MRMKDIFWLMKREFFYLNKEILKQNFDCYANNKIWQWCLTIFVIILSCNGFYPNWNISNEDSIMESLQ